MYKDESMHVKWERRRTSLEGKKVQYELVALLVEGSLLEKSENIEVLATLGAIQERFLRIRISKTKAFHQGLFWVKVDRKLVKLSLGKGINQTIEAQILERVPRPSDDWALWGVTCIPHIDC